MTNATSLTEINNHIKNWGRHNNLVIDCPVFGNFNSEIAIIGNYVHEREKVQQIPFVGNYGECLWNALRIEHITRNDVYQTIAIKKFKIAIDPKKPITSSKEEIDTYGALLRWELAQLPNLKYIVVLGDFALKCLMDLPSNILCQGSVYDYTLEHLDVSRRCKIIVVIDPDTVMKQLKFRDTLTHNLEKLTRVLKGTFSSPIITTIYNEKPNSIINYIRDLMRQKLPTALDIETPNGEVGCLGLANKTNEALCINFRNAYGNVYSAEDELRIWQLLQHWFNRKDEYKPKLVMQNGMFDSYFTGYKNRIRLPPSFHDTMLAAHTTFPDLPLGLDFLVSKYTDMPYYKDQGKQYNAIKDWEQHWRYNGQDCCGTLAVFEKQVPELKEIILPEHINKYYGWNTLYDFFQGHVMRLQPHLVRMTVGGILTDRAYKNTLTTLLKEDVENLRLEIYALIAELTGDANYRPNLNSSQQMAELYFTKLRLVGRGLSTDDDNRERMIAHHKTPEKARLLLRTISKYKEETKFTSTYAEMLVDEDDRIRCEYKQTGVKKAPGRLSSAATIWDGGTNFQNIPGRGQELFIADEGYELSYFDLPQAEARVVGWRFVISQWIKDFERARLEGGYDAHRSLAATMYNKPYDEIPKEDWEPDNKGRMTIPTIRYKAKRCRHGLNYTMKGPLLAQQIGVTVDEGNVLYQIYHRVNPELQTGWTWTFNKMKKDGCLYNAYGRRYISLGRLDESDLGNLVAFYFQSTIGDKVARCIYLCEDDPQWPKTARMILNIHDALVAIHKPEDGKLVRAIMKKYAEEPIHVECMDGIIRDLIVGPPDFKVSKPYSIKTINGEKVKTEDGLHRWSTLDKVKETL